MLKLNHKRLDVWKASVILVAKIYELIEEYPKDEKFGLVSQLRRAAVSIPSNISEGASRSSAKERKRFYEIARSSVVEIDTQLEISKLMSFVSKEDLKEVSVMMNEIFGMLSGMKAQTCYHLPFALSLLPFHPCRDRNDRLVFWDFAKASYTI